jgi:hypothetical protein
MSRRTETRYAVSEIARIRSLAAPRESTNQTHIVDVSGSGFRLESDQPFIRGEEISIRINKLVAFGIVRYCRQLRPGLFSAGVKIHDIVCRSGTLTDLTELLETGDPVGPA